jgi:hypothetical protein
MVAIILEIRKLRQEDHEFRARLCYTARPYLKKKNPHKTYCLTIFFNVSIHHTNYLLRHQDTLVLIEASLCNRKCFIIPMSFQELLYFYPPCFLDIQAPSYDNYVK